jgi:hypothetical protein
MPDSEVMFPAKGYQVPLVELQVRPHVKRYHVMYIQRRRTPARSANWKLFYKLIPHTPPFPGAFALRDSPIDRLTKLFDGLIRYDCVIALDV